mgnify:CR=1 FL=1
MVLRDLNHHKQIMTRFVKVGPDSSVNEMPPDATCVSGGHCRDRIMVRPIDADLRECSCYHASMRCLLLLPLGLILAIGGCSSQRVKDPDLTFDPAGPIAVDVNAFSGDITVEAAEKHDRVRVRLHREAIHGSGRSREAEASLWDIQYDADLVGTEAGQVLRVETRTLYNQPHLQRSHLTITAPSIAGLTIVTTRGRVEAVDVTGPLDISTTEESVEVMSERAVTSPVRIVTDDGDIDYRVGPGSGGTFDATSERGRVLHRVDYGRMQLLTGSGARQLRAVVDRNEAPIVLRTTDGDIRIAVVEHPKRVGRWIPWP